MTIAEAVANQDAYLNEIGLDIRETDEKLNDQSRSIIEAYKEEYGDAVLALWYPNYGEERIMFPASDHNPNFCADIVLPSVDDRLRDLITELRANGYSSELFDRIEERLKEIGAAYLFWS